MSNPQAPIGPMQLYQRDLRDGIITPDQAQLHAIAALEKRYAELCPANLASTSPSLRQRVARLLFFGSAGPRPGTTGLYLWGGVGRGKTYLMDLFFHALPGERKLRMHFHRFMQMVHKRLREQQGQRDPLILVAKRLAAEVDVVCFDEFFVSDIGDAMILANLLEALFAEGVMLVATSNIEPGRLYERGLQRQRFLPAIDLIRRYTEVINMYGGVDYRLRSLDKAEVYHWPSDAATKAALALLYEDLTRGMRVEVMKPLDIEGRLLIARRWAEGVAWFDFATLCRGARGAADYIELARQFHTVLIEDLPCLGGHADDEARRFMTLVDEFYDRGVKLVLAAACALEELYAGEDLRFPFQRTVSRLIEMQSRNYLARDHRPD